MRQSIHDGWTPQPEDEESTFYCCLTRAEAAEAALAEAQQASDEWHNMYKIALARELSQQMRAEVAETSLEQCQSEMEQMRAALSAGDWTYQKVWK